MPHGTQESSPSPASPGFSAGPRLTRWLAAGGIVAVIALGAFLRFHAIGQKSLWLDEAATMNAIDASFAEVFRGVKAHDAHPPLYYLAVRAWVGRSHSGALARAFSAGVAAASLALFYFLAHALLPRGAALVAAAVLAASAFQVYFAQEARPYALAAFFVVVAWYCLAHLVASTWRRRWPLWLGLALANAAALYTFYYTAFSVLAQGVALLALWRRAGRRLLLGWAAWQCVPLACFSIWVPVILERMRLLGQFEAPVGRTVLSAEGLAATAAQFTCGFLAELAGNAGPMVQAAAAGLGLLVAVLAALAARRERAAAAIALVWLLGPLAFLAALPIRGHVYEPKHLAFAAPALALAAGVVWSAARRGLRPLAALLIAALLAANIASLALYHRPDVEKANWRAALREFAENVQPGDIVTFSPPYTRLAFDHYARGAPHIVVWHVPTPPAGEPFRAGELAQGRRVWLFQAASNVERPNPRVLAALEGYPQLLHWSHEGLVSTLGLWLFDTFKPGSRPAPRAP